MEKYLSFLKMGAETSGSTVAILIICIVIIVILVGLFVTCSKIVSQSNAYIVEKLGSYHETWGTGFHFKWPFLYKIVNKVSLKEQVMDFDPQPVITKDNVTMQIDTVVFFTITDPKAFTYGVSDPITAIEKLTATTLRNIIGEIELDSTLTSRDIINSKMKIILDEATDPWGIKVNRVELKNILPPKDIRDAMEKQMRAERERREAILQAEGVKQAAILKAEGEKTAAVLKAQGDAEAILEIQKATAEGISLIKKSAPDDAVLALKSLEALGVLANGQATKIVVPSNLQGIASLATTIKDIIKDNENK
ncbi:putative uncharacterized protein [Coprobacillus sp. CAG:698]|nr:putative uncharacterized protein [Coprobacillus sp. CAG:698]